MSKVYVLSLGGSLLVPNGVDSKFISAFQKFILGQVKEAGSKFIIITGGGTVCRQYQKGLSEILPEVSDNTMDWMGIYVTRLNAQLMRLVFGSLAHPRIIDDPNHVVSFKEKILLAGGWKPGRSTDDDAVRLAHIYGAETIVNLSNIDYVYTKDPRKFKDAQKIEHMRWADFIATFGAKWQPGLHAPFDPVAAKFARKHKQRVIIANGADIPNLRAIVSGKKFKGTVLE